MPMNGRFFSFLYKLFLFLFALVNTILYSPLPGKATEFQQLSLCKDSPYFEKRLGAEVKKLENRLKLYSPESLPATTISREIESTKTRFERYGKSGLLCGKDGLPHLIVTGEFKHASEFILPGFLFLYIAGWIGWVGRNYLIFAKTQENPFEAEIILNIPKAYSIATAGFLWPLDAWTQYTKGNLIASEEEVTVSPR
jgi:photosystem I subunit III